MSQNNISQHMEREPISIEKTFLLHDALEIMRAWGMRHLPIVENNKLVGLISERDIFKALANNGNQNKEIGEYMKSDPFHVPKDTSLSKVVQFMAKSKFGCTVVVNASHEPIGIFTVTDALWILSQMLHDDSEDTFKLINIEEYLSTYRKMA